MSRIGNTDKPASLSFQGLRVAGLLAASGIVCAQAQVNWPPNRA